MPVVSFRSRSDENGQTEVSALRTQEIALLTTVELHHDERFPPRQGWYGSIVLKSGHSICVWAFADDWRALSAAMTNDYLDGR